jgi:hypothetical protein
MKKISRSSGSFRDSHQLKEKRDSGIVEEIPRAPRRWKSFSAASFQKPSPMNA